MENQASGVDKKEWKVLGEESQMQTIEKVLKDRNCLKDLNRLKEQILFVPIDKAGNNIGLISKKNFLEVLHLETKSNTYIWFCESIINAVGKKNLRDRHTCNTRQQDTSTDSCHHQDAQESCKISVHLWDKKLYHQTIHQKVCENTPTYYEDTQEILQQDQVLHRNRNILDYWKQCWSSRRPLLCQL